MRILLTIAIELIQVVGTLAAVLLMRWLLELSTPERDYRWLKRQPWYQELTRLQFYRGLEYLHQINFWRIVGE